MKRTFKLFCAVAAIAALASCAKDNYGEINDNKGELSQVILTAGFEEGTKTQMNAEGKVFWSEYDDVIAFDSNWRSCYATIPENAAGQSSAALTLTLDSGSSSYYVMYPSSMTSYDSSEQAFYKEVSVSQSEFRDGHAAAGMCTNSNSVKMKNMTSMLSFETFRDDVMYYHIKFTDPSKKFPIGVFFTFDGQKNPVIKKVGREVEELIVKPAGAGTYYLGFFPLSGIAGFNIIAETESGSETITINKGFSFEAGNILKLGNIDSKFGKNYKVAEATAFEAVTGDLDENISFAAGKGDGTTAPAVNSGEIRIYKPAEGKTTGGFITVTSMNGDKISAVKFTSGKKASFVYTADKSAIPSAESKIELTANKPYIISGLDATTVTIYNTHTDRLDLKQLSVTYTQDSRTPQTLSFPEESYDATVGNAFSAPAVSGAKTAVTYSSNNEAVATVNANSGAVTLVAAGTATIIAKAAANETYKEGFASYTLNVASGASGIAGIKAAIRAGGTTATKFTAEVTDMVVTFARSEYPNAAYLEDASHDAISVYSSSAHGLAAGDKFSGTISGEGKVYNGEVEITTLNVSSATKTTGASIDPVVVTIADLEANFEKYEYRRIKIEGATVTTALTSGNNNGEISQNGTSIKLYRGNKATANVDKDSNIDLICYPSYNNAHQVTVWEQSWITVNGGTGVITLNTTVKSMSIGDTFKLTASCNSGAAVSFTSDTPSVASVDADGTIHAVAAGTAKIKASAPAKDNFSAAEAYCNVTVSAGGAKSWKLVTSASAALKAGDVVIIAAYADTAAYAMSKTQNSNNRAAEAVTKSNGNINITDPSDKVEQFTLVDGTKAGTFGFLTGDNKYIYAASTSSNYLKTQDNLTDNASFTIVPDDKGEAAVIAQGTNTRNCMRYNYNNGNRIFSCYASTTTVKTTVAIYRYE